MENKLKIVFAGSPKSSSTILQSLIDNSKVEVPYVISQEHTGFEVDLVRAILAEMGYGLSPIYVPFGRTARLLKDDAVDIGLTLNPAHTVDQSILSEPYIIYQNVVVTRAVPKNHIRAATQLVQITALCFASNKPESMMYKAVILATAAHALQAPQLKRAPRAAAVSAIAPAPVWVAGSILGGAAGTPFVVKATNSWYSDPTVLKLPSWTPPNKVFMPVWTVLYGLIGLTGYRAAVNSALPGLAVGHYIANLAWAPLFFGLKKLKLAAALQFALLGSLAAVWSAFKKDARLLIPYAAWLSYATILNLAICRLNPSGVQTVEDRTPTGVAALY